MNPSKEIILCYVSSATEEFCDSKLLKMLEKSRDNNSAVGVTGVLLHRKGTFMQILEGPETAVDRIFSRIMNDSRHTGVLKLLRREVSERAFRDWSMGFRELSESQAREIQTASSCPHPKEELPRLVEKLVSEFKRINR